MRSTIRRPDDSAPPLVQRLVTTSVGRLALALLVVELLAGMQTYLNQTILPLLATDLRARDHYGLVTAAGTVPTFLTMPLGGAMLSRWRAGPLMTSLTALLVAGAVLGAAAPDISVYAAGEVLRGLAAGALSTITMGVMVAGLPEAWRRLCLAAGSAMWVLSSLVGPVYAAGISATWGWRWALVAYTPVLVMARLVMARQMGGLRMSEEEARPPVLPALALASGVAALGPEAAPSYGPAEASSRPASCVWNRDGGRRSQRSPGCARPTSASISSSHRPRTTCSTWAPEGQAWRSHSPGSGGAPSPCGPGRIRRGRGART